MSDLRREAKIFYNSLDFDKPVDVGATGLVPDGFDASVYVEGLHGRDHRDPIQELAGQIDYSDSAGAYLFTGNRGTGKTTELLRLADILRSDEYDCEVFYVDLYEYLYMHEPVEISDFLITLMGALSEKFEERFKEDPSYTPYWQRAINFLRAEVDLKEINLPAGPAGLKMALHQNPTFKQTLQQRTRGVVERLVHQARDFAIELKSRIGVLKSNPDRKVVLIVDSFERLRGDFINSKDVFASVAMLFSSQAENLRFPGISVVYTVPPYLSALSGGIGAYYKGGRINALPSVHIYAHRPEPGRAPELHRDGLAKMTTAVAKRFAGWQSFFTLGQLERLAQNSGGDLRDYFRMIRLALAGARVGDRYPIPDEIIVNAEDDVRRDMLPLAADDRARLQKIMQSHRLELQDHGELPEFARLQDGKYVLQYRNGDDWYDIHPLLRAEVERGEAG